MGQKIYRFLSTGVGIYEAVEASCPRNDERREGKPDGSWLPKVGEKYQGAISFWTEKGLKKYSESGLKDWHYSVSGKNGELLIAEAPESVLYEDEFQVIVSSDIKILRRFPFTYEGPVPMELRPVDNRPKFIRHFESLRDWNAYAAYTGSKETFSLSASFGADLGLQRIALHHEILNPGKRSSWPHAHKVEEELVYILSGNPDIWINGKIFSARSGDCIFFPPGSNHAHTVINNTDSQVAMMVLGEQNQEGDKIYYPKHPDRNLECKDKGFFWEDRPPQEIDNHSGEPGEVSTREENPYEFQKNINDVEEKTFGGEKNELGIFYKTKDLGRLLGAKRVALHYQVLPRGFRSSLPHAESHEEEFVYVIKGHPIVWINGKKVQLNPGDGVAFPSGTGIAHSFINDTENDVELLVSGETTKKENRCAFPVNPEEKEYCEIWWEDYPRHQIGEDSPLPGILKGV